MTMAWGANIPTMGVTQGSGEVIYSMAMNGSLDCMFFKIVAGMESANIATLASNIFLNVLDESRHTFARYCITGVLNELNMNNFAHHLRIE